MKMLLARKEKQQYFIICISLYLFIFSSFFSNVLGIKIFNYLDELIGLVLLIIYLMNCILNDKIKIYRSLNIYVFGLFFIILIGIYSNIVYKIQPVKAIILDLIAFLKFFITLCAYYMFFYEVDLSKMKTKIATHIKIIINILVLCVILDYLFSIFSSYKRWGIPVITLFYGHSTTFGDICILLLCLLLYFRNEIKNYKLYVIAISICAIGTIRFKVFTSVILIYIIYMLTIKLKRKLTINKIIIISIIGILIAGTQIKLYFFSQETARSALLNTSFQISKDYFPVGTGFGTFASSASEKFYSSVYYQYNINTVYGLYGDNTKFISDIFWATLLGEFGILGMLVYLVMIINIFIQIQKLYKRNKEKYFLCISLYIYMIASTLSTSAFLSYSGVMLAFVIGVMLASKIDCK